MVFAALHTNCTEDMKPSTFIHIGEKLLQLAAANMTDGGHYNTRFSVKIIHSMISRQTIECLTRTRTSMGWRLFWNLVTQERKSVYARLEVSARNAPNKGTIFSFEEFRTIITTPWSPDCRADFSLWMNQRFMAVTLLLGALRSEQFDRFRKGGLDSVEWNRDNRDHHCVLEQI